MVSRSRFLRGPRAGAGYKAEGVAANVLARSRYGASQPTTLFRLPTSPYDTSAGGVVAAGVSRDLASAGFRLPFTFGLSWDSPNSSDLMALLSYNDGTDFLKKNNAWNKFRIETNNVFLNFYAATKYFAGDSAVMSVNWAAKTISLEINGVEDPNSPWSISSLTDWTVQYDAGADLYVGQQTTGTLYWQGTISEALPL